MVARADAREKSEHRGTNACVVAQREEVKKKFARNLKDDDKKVLLV